MTASSLTDTFQYLIGYLNQVPQFTEFTSLYDQYCIKGIKATLIPRFNSADVTNTTLPTQIYSCLDYDDSAPTTLAALFQYQNLKMTRGTSIHGRYIKPAVTPQVYAGTLATAYLVKKDQWIDCANDNVPHYGIVFCVPQLTAMSESIKWDLKVDYYLAFKNVR